MLVAVVACVTAGAGTAAGGTPAIDPASEGVEVLDRPRAGEIRWTRIAIRAQPDRRARVITVMKQFRPDFRRQYVFATARYVEDDGRTWYRVVIPGRPNGRTGWLNAVGVDVTAVNREIRIDRSARRLELWEGERRLVRAKVAVGKRGAETPLGLFYVTWKFVPDVPILGAYALETSAYSKLSDWPGGGIVGIHGTPWPWLLGQAVSHGCIRVHNRVILDLRKRVPVGTPVRIVA